MACKSNTDATTEKNNTVNTGKRKKTQAVLKEFDPVIKKQS